MKSQVGLLSTIFLLSYAVSSGNASSSYDQADTLDQYSKESSVSTVYDHDDVEYAMSKGYNNSPETYYQTNPYYHTPVPPPPPPYYSSSSTWADYEVPHRLHADDGIGADPFTKASSTSYPLDNNANEQQQRILDSPFAAVVPETMSFTQLLNSIQDMLRLNNRPQQPSPQPNPYSSSQQPNPYSSSQQPNLYSSSQQPNPYSSSQQPNPYSSSQQPSPQPNPYSGTPPQPDPYSSTPPPPPCPPPCPPPPPPCPCPTSSEQQCDNNNCCKPHSTHTVFVSIETNMEKVPSTPCLCYSTPECGSDSDSDNECCGKKKHKKGKKKHHHKHKKGNDSDDECSSSSSSCPCSSSSSSCAPTTSECEEESSSKKKHKHKGKKKHHHKHKKDKSSCGCDEDKGSDDECEEAAVYPIDDGSCNCRAVVSITDGDKEIVKTLEKRMLVDEEDEGSGSESENEEEVSSSVAKVEQNVRDSCDSQSSGHTVIESVETGCQCASGGKCTCGDGCTCCGGKGCSSHTVIESVETGCVCPPPQNTHTVFKSIETGCEPVPSQNKHTVYQSIETGYEAPPPKTTHYALEIVQQPKKHCKNKCQKPSTARVIMESVIQCPCPSSSACDNKQTVLESVETGCEPVPKQNAHTVLESIETGCECQTADPCSNVCRVAEEGSQKQEDGQ